MKYSKKKGGSPAYALLRQQGLLSNINPVNNSVPLTYLRTDNVSHLIETSGGGKKRKLRKSKKQSKSKRVSKSKRLRRKSRK